VATFLASILMDCPVRPNCDHSVRESARSRVGAFGSIGDAAEAKSSALICLTVAPDFKLWLILTLRRENAL
jgi:hypothetical protein